LGKTIKALKNVAEKVEESFPKILELLPERKKRDITTASASPSSTVSPSVSNGSPSTTTPVSTTTAQFVDADVTDLSSADYLVHNAKMLEHDKSNIQYIFTILNKHAQAVTSLHPHAPAFSLRGEDNQDFYTDINRKLLVSRLNGPFAIAAAWLKDSKNPIITDDETGKQLRFNASDSPSTMQYLTLVISNIRYLLDEVSEMMTDLLRHQFPDQLYNHQILRDNLKKIAALSSELSEADLMEILLNTPLTFPYKRKCAQAKSYTVPTADCPMTFMSVLPIVNRKQVYHVHDIIALPTFHKGVISNDWKKIDIVDSVMLENDFETMAIHPSSLKCIETPAEVPCNLCTLANTHLSPINNCLQKILKGEDPFKVCKWSKLTNVQDQVLQIDDHTFAYIDPNQGSLVEKCENGTQRHLLPPNGLISLQNDCKYVLNNGPMLQSQIRENLDITTQDNIREQDVSKSHDTVLEKHLDDYDIYYIIGLSGTLTLFTFGCSVYCICNRRGRRIMLTLPNRRLPNQRRQGNMAIIARPAAAELSPVLSDLNEAFAEYVQTV
jgi:hypothetical protein